MVSSLAVHAKTRADPLAAEVTIYRDHYGVPHIVGDNNAATFFGYGYAQAEDHLEDMMLQYRDAQGRRTELQGINALGDAYLQFIPYEYRWGGDYMQRLLHTKQCVVEHRDQIAPETYRILDAFARGVNEYIAEHRAAMPDWITPITAEDVEALERSQYMRFYSIHDALNKISEKTYAFPNLGSNQWAISPERSASGHIIHVEHTHMPWANRFQNYEAHLITPGELDAAGISWFGSPMFLMGWNDRITWSATWNEPNIADVYEEKLNPANSLQYLYEGAWKPIRVEYQSFRIKGLNGFETVTLPCYYTHHGPIVKYDPEKNHAYSVRLPNFEVVNYATGLYSIMKARSLAEFQAALARQLIPRWNFLYTDRQNIYWVHNGNVAQRNASFNWSKPVPGWTKETEWGANFPYSAYPQKLNPPSGFLQNCNNPPWVCTRDSGLKPLDPAPYYLHAEPRANAGEEALNARGERLFEVLGAVRKFGLEDMFRLSFDTHIMATDVLLPLLARAGHRETTSPEVGKALAQIAAWDGASSKDSIAYTYVHFWALAYRALFSEESFTRFTAYERKKLVNIESPNEQQRALQALEQALRTIEHRYGTTEVPWGRINLVIRGGRYPLGGESIFNVLHPDEGVEQDDDTIHCNDGWGHLMIVEESNPKQVWTLLPYGESQHPASPHYGDQARMHSEQKPKRFWFSASEILAHTESVWGDSKRLQKLH
ncbi:MAG TPA: penicillin acylase family protein [Bryobacteraceae bacterium]